MAYINCNHCGQHHSQMLQRDAIKLVELFQEGEGQIVTTQGVESRCILDVLGRTSQRKVRESERKQNSARVLSDMLSAS